MLFAVTTIGSVVCSGFRVDAAYVLLGAVVAFLTVFFACGRLRGINRDQRTVVTTAFAVAFLMWLFPPWVPRVAILSWPAKPTYGPIFCPIEGSRVALGYLACQWLVVGLTTLVLLSFLRSKVGPAELKFRRGVDDVIDAQAAAENNHH